MSNEIQSCGFIIRFQAFMSITGLGDSFDLPSIIVRLVCQNGKPKSLWGWWPISLRTVRLEPVISPTPILDYYPSLKQIVEYRSVE